MAGMVFPGDPTQWLLVSGASQILVTSLLGYLMLVPMQPWGRRLRDKWPSARGLMSVHLDMVMLALMQIAAGVAMKAMPGSHHGLAAALLVVSGWMNVAPYVWRLAGVNAFALAGNSLQRFAALSSFAGTLALTTGWIILLVSWL